MPRNGSNLQVILIDTREQKPIEFEYSRRIKLEVGDYTSVAHHNKLHLERKAPGDLYGTILKGHVRFRREIRRAQDNNITLIMIIECSERKFYSKRWPGGKYCKVSDITLKRIITTLTTKYGLEFIWCRDRAVMKNIILKLLK
jgi:ERCC4-type nuclease